MSDSGPVTPYLRPGLVLVHGNRLESLQRVVFDWLDRAPLGPLEEELLLVQSNGIAEWLKMSLAQRAGVCAATRVELPARFLWRTYRAQLGRDAAPARAPLDKDPLTWRLMRLLPTLAGMPGFEPLAQFLAGPDATAGTDAPRRLQLARRLADLYDQYQIYRADWLQAWAQGRDQIGAPLPFGLTAGLPGEATDLAADQRWQALLWRAVLADLQRDADAGDEGAAPMPVASRADVHARFVAALHDGQAPQRPLPRRVVLFGHSHLPLQTLEALAALSAQAQVLIAVPNPCQFHWADMIDGRDLMQSLRRHQPLRAGADLAALPLAEAHAQAHPLLAAWGRQGRDFLRALDHFDELQAQAERPEAPRIPLFDDEDVDLGADFDIDPAALLIQIQARIRDAVPLAEHAALQGPPLQADQPADIAAARERAARDDSVRFHRCHSPLREVEVLHDVLLDWLAQGGLAPRDIVVMVPEIDTYAPLIRAVFDQHGPGDARRIPHDIADLRARGRQPVLVALEWLLGITEHRCTASELRDLLDVPALARRFDLSPADLPLAARWLHGAGVRWGLDTTQRSALGLGACGDTNSWLFGLRRLLTGYACGDLKRDVMADVEGEGAAIEPWQDIDPYDEVGGLDAAVAGSLAELVDTLQAWWAEAGTPASPAQWQQRGRSLLARCFDSADEDERLLVAALHEALDRWADACDDAGLVEPLPLAVLREAWLDGLDEPGLGTRFMGGGVVFCTLMPMRAIPFQRVCLLGMNDGDYPRRAPRSDFDLLALPGQRRPGDRARRDDDRMLMLEALLSARRALHLSWAARSVRDNTDQPPSLLVAQLRDYIAAAWGQPLVDAITHDHPLQPFSRRYFEQAEPPASVESPAAAPLRTYAREWRSAHDTPDAHAALTLPPPNLPELLPLDIDRLQRFLRNPVAEFLRVRLDVHLREPDAVASDDEPLTLDALEETLLLRQVVQRVPAATVSALDGNALRAELQTWLTATTRGLQRQGRLPLAGPGQRWCRSFEGYSLPMLLQWQTWLAELPEAVRPLGVEFTADPAVAPPDDGPAPTTPLVLRDWLTGLRTGPLALGLPVWLQISASKLVRPVKTKSEKPSVRADKLLDVWLFMLLAAEAGHALTARVVGRDAVLLVNPPERRDARVALNALLHAWHHGLGEPLPVALRSALAGWAAVDTGLPWTLDATEAARRVYDGQEGSPSRWRERDQPALARLYPDWDALSTHTGRSGDTFERWAEALYLPLLRWSQRCITIEPLPDAAPPDPTQPTDPSDADSAWEGDD